MDVKKYQLLFAIVTLCWVVGCSSSESGSATVQGTVLIDGELATSGTVSFFNTEGGPTSYGTIHKDGSFTLRVGRGNESNPDASQIPTGDYIATVVVNADSGINEEHPDGPPLPGGRLTADKYTSRETSDLSYRIKPGLNPITVAVDGPTVEDKPEEGTLKSNESTEQEGEEVEESEGEESEDSIVAKETSEQEAAE